MQCVPNFNNTGALMLDSIEIACFCVPDARSFHKVLISVYILANLILGLAHL